MTTEELEALRVRSDEEIASSNRSRVATLDFAVALRNHAEKLIAVAKAAKEMMRRFDGCEVHPDDALDLIKALRNLEAE